MWVRLVAGVVAGLGAGWLLSLLVLLVEDGPDVSLVGRGYVRALAVLGGVFLLAGVVTLLAIAGSSGGGPRTVLIWSVGLGVGAGMFVLPVTIFFQAGNITDATGGDSPGSSWGVLVLVLLGLCVGVVSGLALLRQTVLGARRSSDAS